MTEPRGLIEASTSSRRDGSSPDDARRSRAGPGAWDCEGMQSNAPGHDDWSVRTDLISTSCPVWRVGGPVIDQHPQVLILFCETYIVAV